jgi:hypothetical protein
MTTKRESILAQIATTLAGTTGVSTRIYRSRVEPLTRGESPAIVIEPINDTAEQNTSLPTLDWSLTVRIAVIVRGNVPDQQADATVESLHSKIMADLPWAVTPSMCSRDQSVLRWLRPISQLA